MPAHRPAGSGCVFPGIGGFSNAGPRAGPAPYAAVNRTIRSGRRRRRMRRNNPHRVAALAQHLRLPAECWRRHRGQLEPGVGEENTQERDHLQHGELFAAANARAEAE